jgi:methyl-accepting chemotaxis protein
MVYFGVQSGIGILLCFLQYYFIGSVLIALSIFFFLVFNRGFHQYLSNQFALLSALKGNGDPIAYNNDSVNTINSQIYSAFQSTANQHSELIKNIKTKINCIFDAVLKVFGLSSQMGCTSSDQHQIVNQTLSQITSLIESITESARISCDSQGSALKLSDQANSGSRKIETILNENKMTIQIVNDVFEKVRLLQDDMNRIKEIINAISIIYNQTNLLAVNAAIEAAHSGNKQNNGFSIIAKEIRQLSNKASESVVDISKIVEQASSRFDLVNKTMKSGEQALKRNVETSEEITIDLSVIVQATNNLSSMIVKITTMYEQNSAIADQIRSVMTRMIDSSLKTVEDSNSVDSSMSALMEEIETLQAMLAEFH